MSVNIKKTLSKKDCITHWRLKIIELEKIKNSRHNIDNCSLNIKPLPGINFKQKLPV